MSSSAMTRSLQRIAKLAREDGRYKLDAYLFVQQSLAYAQLELGMGRPRPYGIEGESEETDEPPSSESHLTGQQLCEAIRQFASELFGLMAKVVLNSWGVYTTRDFGEIVYRLIDIGEMTKSDTDRLEDFEGVYDFEEAFQRQYEITLPDES
jgi:uncharacterized repeat protein (TIGR04138 family)